MASRPEFTPMEAIALASAAQMVLNHVPDEAPEWLTKLTVAPLASAKEKLDAWLQTAQQEEDQSPAGTP